MTSEILIGDSLEVLRGLPAGSVQCVVTSPPYFGLRDYGTGSWDGGDPECEHAGGLPDRDHSHGRRRGARGEQGASAARGAPQRRTCMRCGAVRVDEQVGLEATPDEFVARLVAVFAEVRRVLRDDGTLWLNIGDSYCAAATGARDAERQRPMGWDGAFKVPSLVQREERANGGDRRVLPGVKQKDLIGIPWMLAFALRADGWYLRSEIVWAKPNPMPESVRDRPTSAHEKLFLLSKQPRYFYDADAIRESYAPGSEERITAGFKDRYAEVASGGHRGAYGGPNGEQVNPAGRNKRNVWEIATMPYAEAHFATFPTRLVEPCVLAGSSPRACGQCGAPWRRVTERVPTGYDGSGYGERAVQATGGAISGGTATSTLGSSNGELTAERRTLGWEPGCEHHDGSGRCVVLDPFAGSGTVGVVCEWFGRDFVGVELNPEYAALARRRIATDGKLGRAAKRPRELVVEQLGFELD